MSLASTTILSLSFVEGVLLTNQSEIFPDGVPKNRLLMLDFLCLAHRFEIALSGPEVRRGIRSFARPKGQSRNHFRYLLAGLRVNNPEMLDLFNNLVKNLGNTLGHVLVLLLKVLDKAVDLVTKIFDRKVEKEKEKETQQNNGNLQDICDNGTLDDLINHKMVPFFAILSLLCFGCTTKNPKIDVNLVRGWEGHYLTEEDFRRKTEGLKLERGESVWVLSNKTLYNILKERNVKQQEQ